MIQPQNCDLSLLLFGALLGGDAVVILRDELDQALEGVAGLHLTPPRATGKVGLHLVSRQVLRSFTQNGSRLPDVAHYY